MKIRLGFKLNTLAVPAFVLLLTLAPLAMAAPSGQCLSPLSCASVKNGEACGRNGYIEIYDAGTVITAKYCSRYNPLFQGCPVQPDQCNEQENWKMHTSEVRCVDAETGAYTILYTCNGYTETRTRTQTLCPGCYTANPDN